MSLDPSQGIAGLKGALRYVRAYRDQVFVVKLGGEVLQDADVLDQVATQLALLHSLGALVLGFGLAIVVGVPLGFLIGRSKRVSEIVEPVMTAIYAMPPVAFVPFVIIWFGLFFQARVALVFLMAIFEIVVTVATGMRTIEPGLIAVGRSFGASRLKLLRSVILPGALPFVFAALRLGLVRAINGMITAELFFAAVNLGKVMKDAASRFDTSAILAVILLLCLLGLLSQELMKAIEARVMPWYIRKRP